MILARTALATLAVVTAAGVAAAAAVSRASAERPRVLTVATAGLTERARLGPSCLSTEPGGVRACTSYVYPGPPPGVLPVRGGSRLTIQTGATASSMILRLHVRRRGARSQGRVLWTARARAPAGGARVWRVRLPRNLPRSVYLGIFVEYPDFGHATFEAGVRVGPCP